MARLLNRTTLRYIPRGNTPDFPVVDWVINPDMSAVDGFPSKYWVLTGDVVSLMTPAQQASVDTAEAIAQTIANRALEAAVVDIKSGIRIRAEIATRNKRDNYLTNRIIELQNRVQAMIDSTGGVANMRSAGQALPISATRTRPMSDAIADYKADINAGDAD